MTIYDMVYERKYEELLQRILDDMNFKRLSRVELYTMKLLNSYFKASRGVALDVSKEYTCNETDYFRRVFDSLKNCDYEHTKECLEHTMDNAKDPEEFEIYYMLVCDILCEIDKKKIEELDRNIKNVILHKKSLSNEDYRKTKELYLSRLSLEEKNRLENWYTKISIQILDTIQLVKNKQLNRDYFGQCCEGETKEDKVIFSLEKGDYFSAYRYLNKSDYRTDFPDLDYYNMIQIRTLLFLFEKQFEVNIEMEKLNGLPTTILTYLYLEVCKCNTYDLIGLLRDKERLTKVIESIGNDDSVQLKKI